MAEHTPTPWFKNRRLEIGPRPRTDDQHDGMLHPVADVFGENGEADAALIIKAVNNHEALVAALRGLDTLLDFGDDDLPNTWTFDDLSAIKAAFEAARLVLADVGGSPK